ncbi:hypothetical protein I4U23_001362 [Adineta vaga]|nr:hypothetical protein I4U23_001362 [Adineta vaga]
MASWNLRVSIIEPGFMRTPIIVSTVRPYPEFVSLLPNDVQERWGDAYLKGWHESVFNVDVTKHADDPIKVIHVLQHAVMNTVPHIRYRPGFDSSVIYFPLSMLPTGLVDYVAFKEKASSTIPTGIQNQLQD